MSKTYLEFRDGAYPAGPDIFYECGACGESVPSQPPDAEACRCRNIIVDADAGRVSVKDKARFKAYRLS